MFVFVFCCMLVCLNHMFIVGGCGAEGWERCMAVSCISRLSQTYLLFHPALKVSLSAQSTKIWAVRFPFEAIPCQTFNQDALEQNM